MNKQILMKEILWSLNIIKGSSYWWPLRRRDLPCKARFGGKRRWRQWEEFRVICLNKLLLYCWNIDVNIIGDWVKPHLWALSKQDWSLSMSLRDKKPEKDWPPLNTGKKNFEIIIDLNTVWRPCLRRRSWPEVRIAD